MPLWLAPQPLILASKSAARRAVLEGAGLPIEIAPADIDERAVEQGAPGGAGEIAMLLAREKAKAVGEQKPGRVVLGADQTLALGAQRFTKPVDRASAGAQLAALRGKTHELHSAVAVVRDNVVLFAEVEVARLTMRDFSDDFLDAYLDQMGPAVMTSVGGYQVEGPGIQLFEKIEGDHFTILGLPLWRLLAFLRHEKLLAE
jgi:septum formation protein